MLLKVVTLTVLVSLFAVVKCQENSAITSGADEDTPRKISVVYLIPLFRAIPKNVTETEEDSNEIDDDTERRVLPLPRLLLILAPANDEKLSDKETASQHESETIQKLENPATEDRIKRSPSGFGNGCNTCGYNPGGGGVHGGGGQGHGGGNAGSWSTSSSSASSGSWGGGGGGSGSRYQHGRK